MRGGGGGVGGGGERGLGGGGGGRIGGGLIHLFLSFVLLPFQDGVGDNHEDDDNVGDNDKSEVRLGARDLDLVLVRNFSCGDTYRDEVSCDSNAADKNGTPTPLPVHHQKPLARITIIIPEISVP